MPTRNTSPTFTVRDVWMPGSDALRSTIHSMPPAVAFGGAIVSGSIVAPGGTGGRSVTTSGGSFGLPPVSSSSTSSLTARSSSVGVGGVFGIDRRPALRRGSSALCRASGRLAGRRRRVRARACSAGLSPVVPDAAVPSVAPAVLRRRPGVPVPSAPGVPVRAVRVAVRVPLVRCFVAVVVVATAAAGDRER